MSFNLNYQVSTGPKGKKTRKPDIETNQPKTVLLAYNLHVTSDGKLSSQKMDNVFQMSSLELAEMAISEFYSERQALNVH
jgi:hypothetical protein